MSFVGKWFFHSIGSVDENGDFIYLNAEDYLNSPMDYIDESDEEAVADEIRERKQMTGSAIEVCDDGTLYMMMPIPEDASESEIEEAVKVGEIELRNGMISDKAFPWEERNGELWFDAGIEGEAGSSWINPIDEEGFFKFITIRYERR